MAGILILTEKSLAAEAGGETTLVCRIRNTGQVVDQFSLQVLGPAAAFATSEPATLSLFPGAEGEIALTLRPPVTVRAGQVALGVKLSSAVEPASTVVEEASLLVGAFVAITARLTPRTRRARSAGKHRLILRNTGNTPTRVRINGSDPDDVIRFKGLGGAPVELAAGQRREVRIRYRSTATHMTGPPESHAFTLSVVPEGGDPLPVEGNLMQRPAVSAWMMLAVGGAVALLALILVLKSTLGSTTPGSGRLAAAPTAPPTPTPEPTATPAPTPPPVAATPTPGPGSGSSSGGGSSGGSKTPTPKPTVPRAAIPKLAAVPLLFIHGTFSSGDIETLDSTGAEKNLTNNSALDYISLSYSPDGRQVAFVAHASQANTNTFAVYVAGTSSLGSPTQVVANCGCSAVSWSPDGAALAYANKTQLIATQPSPGAPQQVLTTAPQTITALSWTPDSAFVAYGAGGQLQAVSRNGGAPIQIASGSAVNGVSFSPDGTHIAYSLATAGAQPQISVGDLDLATMTVKNQRAVTASGSASRSPKWSRDGGTIYFSSPGSTQNFELFSVPAAGGQAKQLTSSGTALSNGQSAIMNGAPEG